MWRGGVGCRELKRLWASESEGASSRVERWEMPLSSPQPGGQVRVRHPQSIPSLLPGLPRLASPRLWGSTLQSSLGSAVRGIY